MYTVVYIRNKIKENMFILKFGELTETDGGINVLGIIASHSSKIIHTEVMSSSSESRPEYCTSEFLLLYYVPYTFVRKSIIGPFRTQPPLPG